MGETQVFQKLCGRGGTGRRARLRILWFTPCRFNSCRPHQTEERAQAAPFLHAVNFFLPFAAKKSPSQRDGLVFCYFGVLELRTAVHLSLSTLLIDVVCLPSRFLTAKSIKRNSLVCICRSRQSSHIVHIFAEHLVITLTTHSHHTTLLMEPFPSAFHQNDGVYKQQTTRKPM